MLEEENVEIDALISQRGSWTVIMPQCDEIAIYEARSLKQHISKQIEAGENHLIIDLSAVEYIDSTVLGVFIGALKRLRSLKRSLRFVIIDASTKKTMDLTGLDRIFEIFDTLDEALAG